MKLTELILNNFGVFSGEHWVSLNTGSPREEVDKTVVLIGGRNGSGKTTVLEAILLALYGKRSPGVRRQSGSYENFLRGMVSKGNGNSAAVRLKMHGLPGYYGNEVDLARAWTLQKNSVHETFQVLVDGWLDDSLTQQWADHIERIAPVSVSNLFFFDGERIEDFADPIRAASAIENSLKSLMGINEVVQLRKDLASFRQKHLSAASNADDRNALEQEFAELRELETQRDSWLRRRADLHNDVERAERSLAKARAEFERAGGDIYHRREELRVSLESAEADRRGLEGNLLSLAASSTGPLTAIQGLVENALLRTESEMETTQESFAAQAMHRHAPKLLQEATSRLELSEAQLTELKDVLHSQFSPSEEVEDLLKPEQLGQLFAALYELRTARQDIGQKKATISGLLQQYTDAVARVDQLEAAMNSLPSEDEIAQLADKVTELEAFLKDKRSELNAAEDELQSNGRKLDEVQARYRRTVEHAVAEGLNTVDAQQAVESANRADETLERIEKNLKTRLLRRLEQEIVVKAGKLLGKQGLVRTVVIGDSDFQPVIHNDRNERVELWDLSAGERQLFALAMLWSFSEIAEVDLPMVIDTPLGRLDRNHRRHFVERFLPVASHQTLVLSTDEEIRDDLYERLQDAVAQEYTIIHAADTGVSHLKAGYGFRTEADEREFALTAIGSGAER